jgi:hypothetical protein
MLDWKPGPKLSKFYPTGEAKSFYGLTCVAWVHHGSELFRNLCVLQNTIREELRKAGLDRVFSFLVPESFHMTICDIEAGPEPIRVRKFDTCMTQIQEAFHHIGVQGKMTGQVCRMGLSSTITALVEFTEEELRTVLDLEKTIKSTAHVNVRDFAGHISLAYFVQDPGSHMSAIKSILLECEKSYAPEEFTFSQVDFTYFTDMNEYIPVLTIDMEKGTVLPPYVDNIQIIKILSPLLKATTLLQKYPPETL